MTAFTDLTDVPNTYAGSAGKLVGVKSDETGLRTVWASPASPVADLRDFLPPGATTYNPAGPDTGTDVAPYLEAALDAVALRYGSRGTVLVPHQYRLAQGIAPAKLQGMMIKGVSRAYSALVYDNPNGSALWWNGTATGGGAEDLSISLASGLGSTNAVAIRLEGDAGKQPGSMTFARITINQNVPNGATPSYWHSGFVALGAAKQTGARGIRILTIDTMEVFGCSSYAAYFQNVLGLRASMLGSYVPKPGSTGAHVYLEGSADTDTARNEDIHFTEFKVSGMLQVANTHGGFLSGRCGTFATNLTMKHMWGFIEHYSGAYGYVDPSCRLTIW
jgi:hypothetical protein